MKAFGLLAALLAVSPAYASDDQRIQVAHFEVLRSMTLENAVPGTQQKVSPAAPVALKFDALGQSYQLDLEPNDRLLSAETREELAGIALYRGRAAGKPGSWARIVVAGGIPRGLIWDGEQMIVIEAPGDGAVQSATPVVYRLADAYVSPGTMSCGASVSGGSAAAMYTKLVAELAQAAKPGATSELQLSAIGDYAFVQRTGDAGAAIATRLNNVDGIFSEQLGVQLTVLGLETHSDPDHVFSDETDSDKLLDDLGRYRRDSLLHRSHGLTHLYTGKNLDSTTVGIAYLDALCSPRYGAGLTEGRHGAAFESLISAHEIGHNFGAPHDGEQGEACAAESENFIMAASVNGSQQFSPCSLAQMQMRIAQASCIALLPSVDMAISLKGASPGEVLLGNSFNLTFDVINAGTEPATNVVANIVLPDVVTLVSIAASSGTCTDGAGSVTCQVGTVPGGGTRTITIEATASAAGNGEFLAVVSAEADDNAGNNDDTAVVAVLSAVDLVVRPPAFAQVNLDQSTSIRVNLENRSILNATGVELTVRFNAGVTPQRAEWPPGPCTVDGQQVDCEADNFGGQSAAVLDIMLSGATAGSSTYTVTVSSAEADADTSDNSANGSVTVKSLSSSATNGSGGGGPMGLLFMLILGGVQCLRAGGTSPARY